MNTVWDSALNKWVKQTQVVSDPALEYSIGSVSGKSIVNKFGANTAVGVTEVVVTPIFGLRL